MALNIGQLLIIDEVCLARADGLKGIGQGYVLTLDMACQHRTAGYNDGRDVQASCCHEHARNNLITVRDEHERVKLMCLCQCFHGIGNQFAGRQRILHADMTHRNAVTDADCRHQNRCAASHADAGLDSSGNFIQIDVTRNNLAVCGNHADNRTRHLLLGQTAGTQQRTVRHALNALCNIMTS